MVEMTRASWNRTNTKLLAWVNSLSFPLGVAALIFMRVYFGYNWPFPPFVGLVLLFASLIQLFVAQLVPPPHPRLARQQVYSSVWVSLVGVWIYSRFLDDFGLIILISLALPLWPLSHAELLKLREEQT
jgi:hypothetical protein